MNFFLPKTYFPANDKKQVRKAQDVRRARESFLKRNPSNLRFLLEDRYHWMLPYLQDSSQRVVELGAGAGLSKVILKKDHIILSDIEKFDWIDMKVDALDLPFERESVDVFICSYMIHHLAYPACFLKNLLPVLKSDGVVLINEVCSSFLLRLLLFIMRHEGWSYNVDVFGKKSPCNAPDDPWSGNNAIPHLLWRDSKVFEERVKGFKVEYDRLRECTIFILSGGAIAQMKTLNLPYPMLKGFRLLDHILIKMFPQVFALGRRIVLRKCMENRC